jgi:hypothetical protein
MADVSEAFTLSHHVKKALSSYYNGNPLKDFWDDDDTVYLMEQFVNLVEEWSGYE